MPMLNRTDLINDHDAGVRSLNDRGGQELKRKRFGRLTAQSEAQELRTAMRHLSPNLIELGTPE